MQKRPFGLAAASAAVASLLMLSGGSALAIGTLDQSQVLTRIGAELPIPVGQTFTAGISGLLDTVEISAGPPSGGMPPSIAPPVTVTVEITATSGGLPTGAPLATAIVTWSDGGWHAVTFSSPASVVAGTMYAILLVPDAPLYVLGDETNAYAGGQALFYVVPTMAGGAAQPAQPTGGTWRAADPPWTDLTFRTYVGQATPPPTSASGSSASNEGELPLVLVLGSLAGMLVALALIEKRHPALPR